MPQITTVEQLKLNIEELKSTLSIQRLEKYFDRTSSFEEAFDEYIHNIRLSEALYPSLQNCEIALRNAIHKEACRVFKNDLWLYDENNLLGQGKDGEKISKKNSVDNASDRLMKKKKPPNEAGRIIAELSFGFWVGFFNRAYDGTFWRKMNLKKVFPNCSHQIDIRNQAARRLNLIIELRNRVFHHEPIIDLRNLEQIHQYIFEILSWISRDLAEATRSIDRFPRVINKKF